MTKADKFPLLESEVSMAGVASDHQSPEHVLVVDDEPAACKLLSLILAPPIFQYTTAGNGEEALASLESEHFDAVISDFVQRYVRRLGLGVIP